jgi:intron-binding protein aquarius
LSCLARPDQRKGHRSGNRRKLLLRLDPAQYYEDMRTGEPCYESLNLLVRRKAKENNFRAVLETIRSLINTEAIGRAVPQWLYDVLLGYGDPASASYRRMPKIPLTQLSANVNSTVSRVLATSSNGHSNVNGHGHGDINSDDLSAHDEVFDYVDTFLSAEHVRQSFPGADISFVQEKAAAPEPASEPEPAAVPVPAPVQGGSAKKGKKGAAKKTPTKTPTKSSPAPAAAADGSSASADVSPPYRVMVKRPAAGASGEKESVVCVGYRPPNKGPYPEDTPPVNTVRFSALQVEAVRSGMNRGLTLVVGPPGTGKTDVAVQIIVNLYHNFPTQKILLVTHSNAALNDLFLKIMQRDVDQRHLLRLGSGEQALQSAMSAVAGGAAGDGETFSKQGRVDWSLARRLELLGQIQRLAETLAAPGDVGYTCETAEYFYLEHVSGRMARFRREVAEAGAAVREAFPFAQFFSDTAEPLFSGSSGAAADLVVAEGCFAHIDKIFQEITDYRAFELLRTQGHRADYLLTKQVCTSVHIYIDL